MTLPKLEGYGSTIDHALLRQPPHPRTLKWRPRDLGLSEADALNRLRRDGVPMARAIEEFKLTNYVGPISGLYYRIESAYPRCVFEGIDLTVVMHVVPRDEPGSRPTDVVQRFIYSAEACRQLPFDRCCYELRQQIVSATLHEIDEGIVVDGVRLFDPHRNETVVPPMPPPLRPDEIERVKREMLLTGHDDDHVYNRCELPENAGDGVLQHLDARIEKERR